MSNINRAEIHESTWSGPWDVAQQGDVQFTQASNIIELLIPEMQEVSTLSSTIVLDTPLISRLRPAETVWRTASLRDDSDTDNTDGSVKIGTDGIITIYADRIGNPFTGGGENTGFRTFPVSYVSAIVPGFDNQV